MGGLYISNHLVRHQSIGLEARVTSVIIIGSRSTAVHNPGGDPLSGVADAMMIVALSECEPCAVFLQSEASFPMVNFLRMTGYAKILHRRLPLLNSVMPDSIPPIHKRLALRQMLDRLCHRARFGVWTPLIQIAHTPCPTCRTIRLLVILGLGLVIGLLIR